LRFAGAAQHRQVRFPGSRDNAARNWEIEISRSSSYGSLEAAYVVLASLNFDTNLWTLASNPAEINSLLCYRVDPGEDGAAPAAVIIGDAEVNADAVRYGDLDVVAVNKRLAELRIYVRFGLALIEFGPPSP